MAIRKATTAGSRALIGFYAESGGGKTYSALVLARGLAGPTGRIVLIDTENRRGEIYADDPKIGGYDVLPLGEPFTAKAYDAAIQEAEDFGADVIIVDSGSHEWEGPGGVLDAAAQIAEGRAERGGYQWNGEVAFGDWNKPKKEHKKLIQRMQRSSAHVIVCLRAQYKSRQIEKKDFARYGINSNKKTEILRDDYQSPIQDVNFIFELTVHLYFSNKNPGVPIVTKCPDMLLDAFPNDKMIAVSTGAKVAAFYANGSPTNAATATLIKQARVEASKGLESYQAYFQGLAPDQRRELVNLGEHEALKTRLANPDSVPAIYKTSDDNDGRPDSEVDAPGPGYDDENNAPGPGATYVEPHFGEPDEDQF